MVLGAASGPSQAQLDGFKTRALLRAEAPRQRHLYGTVWRQVEVADRADVEGLAIVDDKSIARECLLSGATAEVVAAQQIGGRGNGAIAVAMTTQHGSLAASPLSALDAALALMQAQAIQRPAPTAWLLSEGAQVAPVDGSAHSGSWGLSRAARAEALLPVICIDGPTHLAYARGVSLVEPEIVLLSNENLVPRLVHSPHTTERDTCATSESHLITGGTGGLGLLTARWLAQRGAISLALASRSGMLAREMVSEWEHVQDTNATTLVQRCDTAETTHAQQVLLVHHNHIPTTGIWHAAGVLADGVLRSQTARSLACVYAPKMHGAWTLHHGCAGTLLRICALFSSVAALLGGAGQANYSAANAWLDALAACRRAHSAASASVQWGAWAKVGMAARGAASKRMAAMEAASGVAPIGTAQGLAALHIAVLPRATTCICLLPVRWHCMLADGAAPAFLSTMIPRCSGGAPSATVQETAWAISLDTVLEMARRTSGTSIDADAPLMEAGIDSLGAVELRNQLQRAVGENAALSSTLMFDHPTARQVALHLDDNRPMATDGDVLSHVPAPAWDASQVEIAGTSGALPRGVSSQAALRSMSHCGHDLLCVIPSLRWDVDEAANDLRGSPPGVASRVRHGSFLCDAELFEKGFFTVSAAEASAMDPQQRQLLERGYGAFHVAGMVKASLLGSVTAANVGQWQSEFGNMLARMPAGRSVYASTGFSCSVTCGRVSFVLGLQGPCASYDTACSASLVSNHGSIRALQRLECKMALSAGVNMILDPATMRVNAAAGFTSVRGRSHTFDVRADGYARGEAIDAIACRLGVEGVMIGIVGSAVRQDGRSASLTAPNGQAQQGVLMASAADAHVRADLVKALEAHGTGTALGDPIEANAVAAVFLTHHSMYPFVVGSLKANAGHTEPGAGLAGVLKLVMQLCDDATSPNGQLRLLNPHVGGALRGVRCALPAQLCGLVVEVRTGGVSSFGYSGTIAHALLRHLSRAEAAAFSMAILTYRHHAFPWRERRASPHQSHESLAMFAACWSPAPLDTFVPSRRLLLFTNRGACAGYAFVGLPSCQTVALLLSGSASSTPSMHGSHLALALAQLLGRHGEARGLLVLTCGVVSADVTATSAIAHGGAWGFARVLRLEHASMRTQSVDVSHGAHLPGPAVVGGESDAETEAAWCAERRFAARLRACGAGTMQDNRLANGLYVITGGLGGLGLRAAALLVASGASCVRVASRSGRVVRDGQGGKAFFASLGALACAVACDVGDAADASTLLAGPTFVGVLHAAGVLHDMMVRSQTAQGLDAVACPKSLAASRLRAAAVSTPLEVLALFSSVASTFGNVGQANYAAANAHLDALAMCRRRCGALGSSLQIPAVSGAGMGATTFDEEQLDAMGSISLKQFAMWLSRCLAPLHAAVECTHAVLPAQLRMAMGLYKASDTAMELLPSCKQEALLLAEGSGLPRSTGRYVQLSAEKNICRIELDDPAHFNTLSPEMASDMLAAVGWLAAKDRGVVRSVVLQGAGDHFCPGGNIYRVGGSLLSLVAHARASYDLFDGFCRLRTLPSLVVCAAHGTVLGGGMAISLLTDYVTTHNTATFQVGELSRAIYPAGLFTRTLADAIGSDAATNLYLTEMRLSGAQAREVGLVQTIAPSARDAQQTSCEIARWYARTAEEDCALQVQVDLWAIAGDMVPSDRRVLASDAFAQARGMQLKVLGGSADGELMRCAASDNFSTRGSLRRRLQAALSSMGSMPLQNEPSHWETMSYAAATNILDGTQESPLERVLQMLSSAQNNPHDTSGDPRDVAMTTFAPLVAQQPIITPLAASFADAFVEQHGAAAPLAVLLSAYDECYKDVPMCPGQMRPLLTREAAFESVVGDTHSCLVHLRCAKEPESCQPPLIIAHSLLGDHKGYGRLWSYSIQESAVYALRHRGFATNAAFVLSREGAVSMVDEYATAIAATFEAKQFDAIGASFGAALASQVACNAREAGACPRRLVLIDPPPAVPSKLRMPGMLSRLRIAAMGVLLLHLQIEMGASVWEHFPQLQTLPEDALPHFVTAQLCPDSSSRNEVAARVEWCRELMLIYRQCRHAFHTFSASIDAHSDGNHVLMALSSERWPTFREMFPGITEDVVDRYGHAVTLQLPGAHIAVINRCLSNQEADFTGALEHFVSERFANASWWIRHLPALQKENGRPLQALPASQTDTLALLFSALSASSPPALSDQEAASGPNADAVASAVQQVAEQLVPAVSVDAPLMEAGLDSLGATEFRSRLSSQLGDAKLPETLVFDFPTLRQIEAFAIQSASTPARRNSTLEQGDVERAGGAPLLQVLSHLTSAGPQRTMHAPASERAEVFPAAAINAMGCRLSGGATCMLSACNAVRSGHNAVGTVPNGRWDDRVDDRVAYGAFMDCIQLFDHSAFGLPPAEAELMDPHQRLALEAGYTILHTACYARSHLMGSSTGVFAGIWQSDYDSVLRRNPASLGPFGVSASGCAMLVGRLSYTLGLQGPCIPCDTACSSSLSAAHIALSALQRQEAKPALVMGINVMCSSGMSQLFAAAQMTSPTGKSHTFDARANGYARGEACCSAILELNWTGDASTVLYEASAVRQDGRSASLTAPNGMAQQALLRAALERAGKSGEGEHAQ